MSLKLYKHLLKRTQMKLNVWSVRNSGSKANSSYNVILLHIQLHLNLISKRGLYFSVLSEICPVMQVMLSKIQFLIRNIVCHSTQVSTRQRSSIFVYPTLGLLTHQNSYTFKVKCSESERRWIKKLDTELESEREDLFTVKP